MEGFHGRRTIQTMPIKHILLPEYNFVYTQFHGLVEDLDVRAWVDRMNKELAGFNGCCEIIDLSGEVDFSRLSSETLTQAGSREKERPTAGSGPLAILVSNPLTFGLARAYSSLIGEARTEVRILYSLDECLAVMDLSENQRIQVGKRIQLQGLSPSSSEASRPIDFSFPPDE